MKKQRPISHGSRHRAAHLRDSFRKLREADDETLSRKRELDRDLEYQEWRGEAWICDCLGEAYYHQVSSELAKELEATSGIGPAIEAMREQGRWPGQAFPPWEGPGAEAAGPEAVDPPGSEELIQSLRTHFIAVCQEPWHCRSLLQPSAHEMQVLREFKQRYVWFHDLPPEERWRYVPIQNVLVLVLVLEPFWLRSPLTWVMPPVTDEAACRSLLEHLFVVYPVPACLLDPGLWTQRDATGAPTKWAVWLVLLGAGASLRRAGHVLGWWVNTGLVERFARAPAHLNACQACLWAEVQRQGGDEAVFTALMENRAFALDPTAVSWPGVGNEWSAQVDDPFRLFWQETLEWLVRHRAEVPAEQIPGLLEWAAHRWTEGRAEDEVEVFSWKGRTPAAALRAAERHLQTHPDMHSRRLAWPSHGWDWEGQDETGASWTVRELITGEDLFRDGAAMRHCVGGYVYQCAEGGSAIFSFRREGRRTLTAELRLAGLELSQVYGACNRGATALEEGLVRHWCEAVLPGQVVLTALKQAAPGA